MRSYAGFRGFNDYKESHGKKPMNFQSKLGVVGACMRIIGAVQKNVLAFAIRCQGKGNDLRVKFDIHLLKSIIEEDDQGICS